MSPVGVRKSRGRASTDRLGDLRDRFRLHHAQRGPHQGHPGIGPPPQGQPVAADDLLPERVLAGDAEAVEQLRREIAAPLREAGGELASTVECYLDVAGVLEAAARRLYVHPNTVRYRLRRVAELTGRHPGEARGALALRLALSLDRLHADAGPP